MDFSFCFVFLFFKHPKPHNMFGSNLERLESETHLSTNLVSKCSNTYFNTRINAIYQNLWEVGLEIAGLDFEPECWLCVSEKGPPLLPALYREGRTGPRHKGSTARSPGFESWLCHLLAVQPVALPPHNSVSSSAKFIISSHQTS